MLKSAAALNFKQDILITYYEYSTPRQLRFPGIRQRHFQIQLSTTCHFQFSNRTNASNNQSFLNTKSNLCIGRGNQSSSTAAAVYRSNACCGFNFRVRAHVHNMYMNSAQLQGSARAWPEHGYNSCSMRAEQGYTIDHWCTIECNKRAPWHAQSPARWRPGNVSSARELSDRHSVKFVIVLIVILPWKQSLVQARLLSSIADVILDDSLFQSECVFICSSLRSTVNMAQQVWGGPGCRIVRD